MYCSTKKVSLKILQKFIKLTKNVFSAFRCSKSNKLQRVCGGIAGDANLYTLFRVDGQPIQCPFGTTQSFKFSYNRGKGDCKWPESELVPCTDNKRFTLHYQACPNVQGSELMSKSLSLLTLGYFSREYQPPFRAAS